MSPYRTKAPLAFVRGTAVAVGVTALFASSLGSSTSALHSPSGTPRPTPGLTSITAQGIAAGPVTPEVTEYSFADIAKVDAPSIHMASTQGAELVVTTEPQPVTGYGVIGATWEGDRPVGLRFAVRTRVGSSGWSPWQPIHGGDCPCAACVQKRAASGHGPDAGTAEFRNARPGTDALAIGEVDELQVKVTSPRGGLPDDLTLAVVDPEPEDAAAGADLPSSPEGIPAGAGEEDIELAAAVTAATTVEKPQIFTRAQWGADERLRSGKPSYGTIQAGFVHHTVNGNSYTRDQVPSIIRGIYAYHTKSRGWSDIGYNFLVDKFGRIWEGRYGGVDKPVVGAHTYGYNHTAFAMSAIGNFDVVAPPSVMLDAYGALFAWKLGLHGIAAKSTTTMGGKKFNVISGHRDAGSTACPGRYLYEKLGAIRDRAANRQSAAPSAPTPEPTPEPTPDPTPDPAPDPVPTAPEVARDLNLDGLPDLLGRDESTGRLDLLAGQGGPGVAARRNTAISTDRHDLFTGVGDVTGDGRSDLLIRVKKSGVTHLRPGHPGGFSRSVASARTTKFKSANLFAGAGNIIGLRQPDLLVRDKRTNRLWVYPGKKGGTWGRAHLVLRKAGHLTSVSGAGDLNGDGRPDLIATTSTHLLLYPGLGKGKVGNAITLSNAWGDRAITVAGPDLTGDGRPNLLARDRSTGRTWIYAVDGGRLGERVGGWTGWGDLRQLTVVGDPGTGKVRLLGRTASKFTALDALETGWFRSPAPTGQTTDKADFVQLAGDWDADGQPDVVTRSASTGALWLYRGTGDGQLLKATRLLTEMGDMRDLVVVPDMTGDQLPDLVARDTDGALYAYPSDGGTGVQPRTRVRPGLFATDLVTSAGLWDGDQARDLIVRNASDKRLYLLPGTTSGTFGTPVAISASFAGYDQLVGTGDLNGDGQPDLLAREAATGRMWLFPRTLGGIGDREFVADGLGIFDKIG